MSERAAEIAERRLTEARADLRSLARQNEALNSALKQARAQLVSFGEQLKAFAVPPLTAATVVAVLGDDVVVSVGGRTLLAPVAAVEGLVLTPGARVWLNEGSAVIGHAELPVLGDVTGVVQVVAGGRLIVSGPGEGREVLAAVELGPDERPIAPGDVVLVDRAAGLVLERLPAPDEDTFALEEIPDVTYADIGGLADQIERIRDAVELPFLERERFARYRLAAPKGVLLYGPPGCGKTMIAKAIASSLAEQTGGASRFLSVKGPELLNKFVGETERHIREVFALARRRAADGDVVVIFFDELDALFRTRGSGVSSDVENTIVPAVLAELDGVEALANVLVVGATNREDMIDPALLRPGRLDVKIRLDRPDAGAAREIFAMYLTSDLPLQDSGPEAAVALVDAGVAAMFAADPARAFVEVTYRSGESQVLTFGDFASGAVIAGVAARAKRIAIKRELTGGPEGLTPADVEAAVAEEFAENADLPSTTNPDDWARIAGRREEPIAALRRIQASG